MIPDTNDIATEAQASHIEKPKSICVSFSLRTILVYTAGPISKSIPVCILIIFYKVIKALLHQLIKKYSY